MTVPVVLAPEVAEALGAGEAVVALESTIISHGMPHPRNVETALAVEAAVRDEGAVPATVAVVDGALRAGLERHEIERIGHPDAQVTKVSRRDLAFVLRAGGLGGTTVAATMFVAAAAGIDVFATGGVGGVHRGAGETFDVSADLQELARTDVTVVCAGVKSILDIGLTLEYLETHSVPVVGFRTDVMPAFYTPDSGFLLDQRLETPEEVAEVIRLRRELGLGGGMLVANPIAPEDALDPDVVGDAIRRALEEAERDGVAGKAATPYVLGRVTELTGARSLESNVALVVSNARLAARIARALITSA